MSITVKKMSDLASAMEITKYPNSPLIKSLDNKSVLVLFDNYKEYILGYVTKADVSNIEMVYSQFFSDSYGHSLNDLYNNAQNPNSIASTMSKKKRTVLVGNSNFIGAIFHDGDATNNKYGFNDNQFWKDQDYDLLSTPLAPVAPVLIDEANFLSLNNGNKIYHSSSGSLKEFNAVRINIGVGGTDIHSFGTWTPSTLSVETPIERLERSITENDASYASGARLGFPDPSTYHIYNFVDNSSFFMGAGIIELEKANADNSVYAKTVYDANGITVNVDSGSKVTLSVDGSPPTTVIIEDGVVTITTPSMSYDGNVVITGTLQVDGKTTLKADLDVGASAQVKVTSGKLITTGMADLA